MHANILKLKVFIALLGLSTAYYDPNRPRGSHQHVHGGPDSSEESHLHLKYNPAPSGNRCGVCPSYLQKVCAFNMKTNQTYIFDNHCVMDLYNCLEEEVFTVLSYDHCLYFGNFAYVHGLKKEDLDYEEDHYMIKSSKKNPDFVK